MNEKTAYWDGRYAVWSEALNSNEIMALSQGADPRSIRPDALREYAPLYRVGDGYSDEGNAAASFGKQGHLPGDAPCDTGLSASHTSYSDEALERRLSALWSCAHADFSNCGSEQTGSEDDCDCGVGETIRWLRNLFSTQQARMSELERAAEGWAKEYLAALDSHDNERQAG